DASSTLAARNAMATLTSQRPDIMSTHAVRHRQQALRRCASEPPPFRLFCLGIQYNAIGIGNLHRLLSHLRASNGMTLDEFSVEIDPSAPIACSSGCSTMNAGARHRS